MNRINYFLKKNFSTEENRRYLELIWVLTQRYLTARYRGSSLGVYWSMVNPMVTTAVYTAIFGATFKSYYNDSVLNYVLAVFTGIVMMQFFSAATTQALSSIVNNGGVLNQIKLPVSIFPVSTVAANLFQFTVAVFPLLAIVTLIRSHSIINVIALPFPILSLAFVCLGIALIVSTLYVFFRDLPYFYEVVTLFLFISTPIFYPIDIVAGRVRFLLNINPIAPTITCLRQITLSGELPDLSILLGAFLSGIILLGIGSFFFQNSKENFMDLL